MSGDHLLLAKDREMETVSGRNGPVDPLVPVAASIRFSGLVAFSLVDDDELDEQIMSMRTASDEPFGFTYIEHPSEMLGGASFEALTLSDIPDNLSIQVSLSGMEYLASSGIE